MALEAVDHRIRSPIPFNLLLVYGGRRMHAFRDERSELFQRQQEPRNHQCGQEE